MNEGVFGGCTLSFPVQKNLHKGFARLSPVFVSLAAVLAMAAPAPAKTNAEAAATAAVKRQSASSQYARAQEQREALNSKPPEKPPLAYYKPVLTNYRPLCPI